MSALLVSVRDADEAKDASAGGADIIDVKEPNRGSPGCAGVDSWRRVAACPGGASPLSVALGELMDYLPLASADGWAGIQFAKWGLASSVLAVRLNKMALDIDIWPLAALVFLFRQSLNLGLALIAMFVRGVRLNMLEFCNNFGMQWIGYPDHPFTQRVIQQGQAAWPQVVPPDGMERGETRRRTARRAKVWGAVQQIAGDHRFKADCPPPRLARRPNVRESRSGQSSRILPRSA